MDGSAIVTNVDVRGFALTPPCAPFSPLSSVTLYRVWTPSRSLGFHESTVRASFHLRFPGGTAPVSAFWMLKPACAAGSIGWLKATSTSWYGPQKIQLVSGWIRSTAGMIVVNVAVKSCCSTPSAAEVSPFATVRLYVVAGARSDGRK